MSNKSNASQLEEALDAKLGDIELDRQENQYRALASSLDLPFSNFKTIAMDPDALKTVAEDVARAGSFCPFSKLGSKLGVAVIDPSKTETAAALQLLEKKGFALKIFITSPDGLSHLLKHYAGIKISDTFEVGAIDVSEDDIKKFQNEIQNISDLKNKVTQISTTKLIEVLIAGALKIDASDIHFEPERINTRTRYRIDGVLVDVTELKTTDYQKLVSRIKVLTKMKLNIHSSPQDGRFTIKETDTSIEVRVSVLPSEYGETIVMRLLDPRKIKQNLNELGIREDLLTLIKAQLSKPDGTLLTTGPTGSGKTTSLYAFINYLNEVGSKIITIEDPIEYHINGISQTQVDPSKGYTFANGLRAIVRQDPDIILVGEIRDMETAEIALHAALTGHLVLSTIHTNNAAGTVPRLLDLGIKPQILAPAISMAMAQRLIRRLCLNCRIKKEIEPETLVKIKKALDPIKSKFSIEGLSDKSIIYHPGKCIECNETGYKGRIGVYEAFIISRELEEMILTSPSVSAIEDQATKEGMTTMLQDAYMKLIAGITSMEEIERILGT
jgi:type IV pilus assembly protein PilB